LIERHEPNFAVFKVVRSCELLFEVSANEGVRIYSIDFDLNLRPVQSITKYGDHVLHIADVTYHNNQLLILDHKKGLFIYANSSNTFVEKDTFALELS
jgi:hypothetical protein